MGEADSDRRRSFLQLLRRRRSGIHRPRPAFAGVRKSSDGPPTFQVPAIRRAIAKTRRAIAKISAHSNSNRAGSDANSYDSKRVTPNLSSRRKRDYNWLELTEPMIYELRDELFS